MGIEIEYFDLERSGLAANSRLLIYYRKIREMQQRTVSINVPLAKLLMDVKPKRRTMQLERLFNQVLSELPDGVIIRDIDVMFHPDYKVDVLKILVEARRHKVYSVEWPGTKKDGKLIYSEEGYPDYRVFEIKDYDVTCVI